MSIASTLPMVLVVAGALLSVTSGNILHAVFGLGIALLGVAGTFLVLGSPFLAAMQVLIYVGGIAVTMIFAVMMSSVRARNESPGVTRRLGALAVAVAFFLGMASVITRFAPKISTETGRDWTLESIGQNLLTRYNVAFETLSIVLLLAIVGAIVIVRKKQDAPPTSRNEEATDV